MRIILALTLCLSVSACGRNLFSKYSPDEFAVTSRAPLTVPPEYSLKAPVDEDEHAREQAQLQAKAAHSEKAAKAHKKKKNLSKGEQALLAKTGADQVDASIRDEVNQETSALKKKGTQPKIGEITGKPIEAEDESIKIDEQGATK